MEGDEQLLEEKRDIVYDQNASNPDSNTIPMITDDVHTMEDNIPQNELILRDTTVFHILDKFSDIINDFHQQLHEEKIQNRSLAAVNLDLKLVMEKIILENKKLAEQLDSSKNILEASEIQQKSGINFSMESIANSCSTRAYFCSLNICLELLTGFIKTSFLIRDFNLEPSNDRTI